MKNIYKIIVCVIYLKLFLPKCGCYEQTGINASLIRVYRQTRNGCVLPQHPKFGEWSVYKTTATRKLQPGDLAPLDTILLINCQDSYKLDGDATMVCIPGKWTSPIGNCLLTCPSRYSTSIMTVTCTYEGRYLENCEQPVDGTRARFQCADFYEDMSLEKNPIHVCYNGKWNYNLPDCSPVCGQKKVKKDPTLILRGKNASELEYPWQVALYNNTDNDLICGGSLISQRVVLTAAHCVADDKGKMYSKEIYTIAVGKYYRKFDDERDTNAQFSAVYRMFTPKQYKGEIQNFFGDIALLISSTTFTLSLRVQPVCIDWGMLGYKVLLNPTQSTSGLVTGWGYTVEYKNPSEVLKELEVPLISDDQCAKKIPEDYERFITDDKICAGYIRSGIAVCRGDSGGGLVAKYKGRYYLIAVVSLSPQAPTEQGGCDSQQYGLYTRVPYYLDFILDKTVRYKFDDYDQCDKDCVSTTTTISTQREQSTTTENPRKTCVLPEHPENGRWSIFGYTRTLRPGVEVVPGTILKLSCQDKTKLTGSGIIACDNGNWTDEIGSCLKECPSLQNSETILFTCSFNNTNLDNCSNPFDGVIAKYTCAPFYENVEFSKSPVRVCVNGTWDNRIPECVPKCGIKYVAAQPLIINGKVAQRGEFPWHIALYRNKQFYCGGTLISTTLILTASHCVSNYDGKPFPLQDFVVAAGKYHVEYLDTYDEGVQLAELQNIFIPPEYTGTHGAPFGNIACLVTKEPFKLSTTVQPACMDWTSKLIDTNSLKNASASVAGWGYTSTGKLSPVLRSLAVPIISEEQCLRDLPSKAINLLTPEKFCAGYLNKSTSLCSGDSGGGLVIKRNGRYYIVGIVSNGIPGPTGFCNSDYYTLYTKISYYSSFILDADAQTKSTTVGDQCENTENCPKSTTIKPEVSSESPKSSCVLPPYPSFGKWSVLSNYSALSPGMMVPVGAVILVSCYSSYKLNGDSTILCVDGKWSSTIGRCDKLCPPVYSTRTTKAICIQTNNKFENCTEATNGVTVKFECMPYYESDSLSRNPIRLCRDGSWDSEIPQCIAVCGRKTVVPLNLIVNGNITEENAYPWHVAIYRGSENEFICSGALISENVVITSAVCVADSKVLRQSVDKYTVVAGKFYRQFDDPRDSTAQQRKLKKINIHPDYESVVFIRNVAVLVTKNPFILSSSVQPICNDWNFKTSAISSTLTGYVTGWGLTNKDKLFYADQLQELEVPLIDDKQCAIDLPVDFRFLLTSDRFCAGYKNQSKGICNGDSGGPLVVKGKERYYLAGLADVAPLSPSNPAYCDDQIYGLYTNISKFTDFILPIVSRHRVQ